MDFYHPDYKIVPNHVGIIPDGGRRYASIHNISLEDSYKITLKRLHEVTDFLFSRGVNIISIYVSSIQNYKRDQKEIDAFSYALSHGLQNEASDLVNKYGLNIRAIGNHDAYSNDLLRIIESNENYYLKSPSNDNRTINLCIAYNPIQEITEAARKTTKYGLFIDELWIREPVNLIIRSGNANLISNFLPIQSGFARLYFMDKLFNDITLDDVKAIYQKYMNINRKYGE